MLKLLSQGSRNAKDLWTYDWGSKKYVCTVCGAAYKHKHNLLGHLRAHTGETYCAFCDKVYSTKGNFDTHMTTVHRRKPSVSGSQSLEMFFPFTPKHIPHNGDANWCYQCLLCGAEYPSQDDVTGHITTRHNFSRFSQQLNSLYSKFDRNRLSGAYRCPLCNADFAIELSLKKHMVSHAEDTRCHICHKTFVKNGWLMKHLKNAHDIPLDIQY
ncbi:zinc finger Y-chromosomal protein 1 [Bemisia tabaci]|uniref:zinc finger Y-chromosomal protein 1 n=1 Tax=Bemisia tabaci TaxID=7038 RepID=UPI003B283470